MTHEDDPNTQQESTSEYHDSGHFDSAAGWQPPDKWAKVREQYRKKHPEILCRESMFETRGANECVKAGGANKRQTNLFGNMWRTGEVALLFGETGVGKSILAMQIAESIARGRLVFRDAETWRHRDAETGFPASQRLRVPASPQPVLYLDFEHSDAQFNERYSCPSPIPGKLPVKYRFSPRLRRTQYGDLEIPEAFGRDLARYFEHSLNLELQKEPAKVIVIDNLSWLDPRATGTAAAVRRMRSLKLYATATGASILVITHAKTKSSPPARGGVAASRGRGGGSRLSSPVSRPLSLQDIALGPEIAQIADSVLALQRTTFAPDIRYIKHLKSNSAEITHGASNVLVYQLQRMENASLTDNGQRKTENAGSAQTSNGSPFLAVSTPSVPGSQLSVVSSQFPPKPFLGFRFLGVSAEEDLIRDYEREFLEDQKREQQRLKKLRRSSRDILVDGIISGDYQRYLER